MTNKEPASNLNDNNGQAVKSKKQDKENVNFLIKYSK